MNKPCPYCLGGCVLEVRVQADHKLYVKCVCDGNTPPEIVKQAFAAGYKRAEEDIKEATKNVEF